MKGIILAGGAGTRLYPTTEVSSKQLQPIYDKPMIYYPLTTLMLAGIKDILIISTPKDLPKFKDLLGDGKRLGIHLSYLPQEKPQGISQAFLIAKEWLNGSSVCLILGDNVFYGKMKLKEEQEAFYTGAKIFAYQVKDPERYGVLQINQDNTIKNIDEKPKNPKSNYAITGIYFFDSTVVERTKSLKPSSRGELEITDLINTYLKDNNLDYTLWGRGVAWLDTGTPKSLLDTAVFVNVIEERQGLKMACIEEVAYRNGFISGSEFESIIKDLPKNCDYRKYLERILEKERNN